jgi:hypothetical protein
MELGRPWPFRVAAPDLKCRPLKGPAGRRLPHPIPTSLLSRVDRRETVSDRWYGAGVVGLRVARPRFIFSLE